VFFPFPDFRGVRFAAHKPLDAEYRAFRIGYGLALGDVSDQTFFIRETDYGGRGASSFRVGYAFGFLAFHDEDTGIGGPQVYPDYFTHIASSDYRGGGTRSPRSLSSFPAKIRTFFPPSRGKGGKNCKNRIFPGRRFSPRPDGRSIRGVRPLFLCQKRNFTVKFFARQADGDGRAGTDFRTKKEFSMNVLRMTELPLADKRVLIREDLNVPVRGGKVTGEARIAASLPGIRCAKEAGARVMLMSHLGRPGEGVFSPDDSLAPVAERLSELLGEEVPLVSGYTDGCEAPAPGRAALFENVRFNRGEGEDDEALGKKYAALCDIFVMDAFGTAHRAQASTCAVARFAPAACAGPLLCAELDALGRALAHPKRPLTAVIGGSKVSTKLTVLENLSKKTDRLIVGGGIANNFLKAAGYEIGKSLYEPDLVGEAARLAAAAEQAGGGIPLPVDVVVGREFSENSPAVVKKVSETEPGDMILDIGPETRRLYERILAEAGSIVWNGPVGAFELPLFSGGTESLCRAVAASPAFSIAGGGDTLAAVEKYGQEKGISHMSTGGGAFLEFLGGGTLPAVAVLEERAR
jgi:phosphoglycerate kinase